MIRRDKSQKQKIHLLMTNRSLVVDEARRVGSQLISDQLNGIAIPGREAPTPSFVHREPYRSPAPEDDVDVYSYNPVDVEHDSQFLNVDAYQIWSGARTELESESDTQRRFERWIMSFTVVVMAIFMFVAVGMAFQVKDDGDQVVQPGHGTTAPVATPTPIPAPILPRVGGN